MTTTYVVLLRAINVAGKNLVAMADLRAMVAELGFTNVRTLLQSGNCVCDGDSQATADLEARLEAAFADRFAMRVDFVVRTPTEWRNAVANNPFPDEAIANPGRLLVYPLKSASADIAFESLRTAHRGPEVIALRGRDVYVVYPDGIGVSKLTTAVIEARLGTRTTGRNWNTVTKIAEMLGGVHPD